MAEPPYQSLYRRYRPQRFSEVRGQEQVTTALRNAVHRGRVAHAYLFSGPRGTGKTSTARILAKALNCEAPEEGEPCGRCASCLAVADGSSLDVHELDAASNNGVDAMRDLVARAALGTPGRHKIYIVDEVHMLTAGASNTLLKTLEEPPGHVVFVLATTDPHKVLPTIRSRTQHFEFRLLPGTLLTELLEDVEAAAGLDLPPAAVALAVRRGNGSARDALSALDQVAAAGTVEDEVAVLDDLIDALAERDAGGVLVAVGRAIEAGRDPQRLANDIIEQLRQGFLATVAPSLVALPDDARDRVAAQAGRLGTPALVRAVELLGQALVDLRDALDTRVALEAVLVRLARPDADASPSALLERIERLEHRLAASGTASAREGAHRSVDPVPEHAGSRGGDAAPEARSSLAASDRGRGAGPEAGESGGGVPPPHRGSTAGPAGSRAPGAPGGLAEARATLGAFSTGPPTSGATRVRPAPRSEPAEAGTGPGEAAGTDASEPAGADPSVAGPGTGLSVVGPDGTEHSSAGPASTTISSRSGGQPASAPAAGPSRDDLVEAWADGILPSLRGRARALYRAGRFLSAVGGVAVFALPGDAHKRACEPCLGDVEAALTRYFGYPVRLRLVVDEAADQAGADDAAYGGQAMPAPGRDEADEGVDASEVHDLPEAPASAASIEERLLEAFPGAREIRRP